MMQKFKKNLNKKLKTCDLTIETGYKFVNYVCPYCGSRLSIDYDDFEDDMLDYDWSKWEGKVTFCDECDEKFKIGDVEVDYYSQFR